MLKQFSLVCIAMLLATTSAFAQLAPTNDCTGQPNATGQDMGDLILRPAFPVGATDELTVNGDGCEDVAGPDSVWCFIPTADCTADFELTPDNANDVVALTVVQVASCSNTVSSCPASSSIEGLNGEAVIVTRDLTAGSLWCVYGATDGAAETGGYDTAGLADCGALPVELESISVE